MLSCMLDMINYICFLQTGAEFFAEERKFIGKPPLNITQFQYSQYCHDATWTLAYALNKTLNSEVLITPDVLIFFTCVCSCS